MSAAVRRRFNPAYAFIAPALTLIGVFFLIPAGASLLLSLTDFDLYAVADPRNLPLIIPTFPPPLPPPFLMYSTRLSVLVR